METKYNGDDNVKLDRYEDYGIIGVNLFGADEQRIQCPECPTRQPYKHASSSQSKDLAVNISKATWICHRCGWSGGLSKNIDDRYNTFIPKAIKHAPITAEQSAINAMNMFFHRRGIPKEILEKNGITLEKAFVAGAGKNAIAFKYFVENVCVNIKYRTWDKQFSQTKGGQKVFYRLDAIKDSEECIITEGEIDAISFDTAGITTAISVPDGAINPEARNITTKLDFVENSFKYLSKIKRYYLALDTDAPGVKMREELARRLGKSQCYIIRYPSDCKDANEVLVKHGKQALKDCYSKAIPYPIEGYIKVEDKVESMQLLYEAGYPTGYITRWSEFDKKLKFYAPSVIVITGLPSHGKSNWMDELMLRLALYNDCKFGVFSSENGSVEAHLHRLTEILIGKPLLPTYNNRMTTAEMKSALQILNDNFYFIEPDKNTFDNILEILKYLVQRFGITGAVIDPWNVIEHDIGTDTETKYIEKQLNRLTYFAREHRLMLFIVAHPTKMPRIKGQKKYEVPTLYDINGSANWYNKAEVGISVYRDFSEDFETTNYTGVFIQKVKHKHWGRTGLAKFHFESSCQRFVPENEKHEAKPLKYIEAPAEVEIEDDNEFEQYEVAPF